MNWKLPLFDIFQWTRNFSHKYDLWFFLCDCELEFCIFAFLIAGYSCLHGLEMYWCSLKILWADMGQTWTDFWVSHSVNWSELKITPVQRFLLLGKKGFRIEGYELLTVYWPMCSGTVTEALCSLDIYKTLDIKHFHHSDAFYV
jgi:hypothetical protein